MSSNDRLETGPLASFMADIPVDCRINIPLSRVLDFARHEPLARPSQQHALGLRPLLALALATAGHVDGKARGQAPNPVPTGDSEILFSALSTLVEVVKSLTPDAGKMYAHLGHQAISPTESDADADNDGDSDRAGAPTALAAPAEETSAAYGPRSEVVIELVSTASSAYGELPALLLDSDGSVAFELAVVAAIVESKGGQLSLGEPGGQSRSFVVRLPVYR